MDEIKLEWIGLVEEDKWADPITVFDIEPPAERPIPSASTEERQLAHDLRLGFYRPDGTMIGTALSCDTEAAYDEDSDRFVRARIKTNCPHCKRRVAPLLSKRTRCLQAGWRWVGLDHKEPYEDWLCFCPGCRKPYLFTTYTPQ